MTINVWVLQLKKEFLPYETSGAPPGPPLACGPREKFSVFTPCLRPCFCSIYLLPLVYFCTQECFMNTSFQLSAFLCLLVFMFSRFYVHRQGRRQGVTTENLSRGPQAKGGPGGPQEALNGRIFFFKSKTRTLSCISGP